MFRGYNTPRKSQIFGPSATGGTLPDAVERDLYMTGEGLGSFFSSIIRKILPAAANVAKKVAGSKVLRETGKQLLDSGVNAATNVAIDAISGQKPVDESAADELSKARGEIANALKNANKKRQLENSEYNAGSAVKKKKTAKKKKKLQKYKKKRISKSVFDDDDD